MRKLNSSYGQTNTVNELRKQLLLSDFHVKTAGSTIIFIYTKKHKMSLLILSHQQASSAYGTRRKKLGKGILYFNVNKQNVIKFYFMIISTNTRSSFRNLQASGRFI